MNNTATTKLYRQGDVLLKRPLLQALRVIAVAVESIEERATTFPSSDLMAVSYGLPVVAETARLTRAVIAEALQLQPVTDGECGGLTA